MAALLEFEIETLGINRLIGGESDLDAVAEDQHPIAGHKLHSRGREDFVGEDSQQAAFGVKVQGGPVGAKHDRLGMSASSEAQLEGFRVDVAVDGRRELSVREMLP